MSEQPGHAIANRPPTQRAIVRYLRRDTGRAGLATAAVAHKIDCDTKQARAALESLADSNVVERVGAPGLGGGQWRLRGDGQ